MLRTIFREYFSVLLKVFIAQKLPLNSTTNDETGRSYYNKVAIIVVKSHTHKKTATSYKD